MYDKVVPDANQKFPVLFDKVKDLWTRDWNVPLEDLAKIKSPCLVMSGDHDMIPLPHTLALFGAIPHSELCVVPGTSHDLIEEKPRLVNSAITDFLNR